MTDPNPRKRKIGESSGKSNDKWALPKPQPRETPKPAAGPASNFAPAASSTSKKASQSEERDELIIRKITDDVAALNKEIETIEEFTQMIEAIGVPGHFRKATRSGPAIEIMDGILKVANHVSSAIA